MRGGAKYVAFRDKKVGAVQGIGYSATGGSRCLKLRALQPAMPADPESNQLENVISRRPSFRAAGVRTHEPSI